MRLRSSSTSRRLGLRIVLALAPCVALVGAARTASAQVAPSPHEAKPVSEGKTDIAKGGFQGSERPADADKEKQATELTIAAGALLSGGNSRLLAATTASKFRYRRTDDQLKLALAANYGMTAKAGDTWQTTVENLQGLARYDRFFGAWVLFLASQQRHDRFQGLDLRMQLDPGVAYYFIDDKLEHLWLELGYDLRYDIRRDDALTVLDDNGKPVLDTNGQPKQLDRTAIVHSVRLFAGYDYKITDTLLFSAGLEYLQAVTDSAVYRINGDVSLSAKIADRFAIALAFNERYENRPLPGKQQLDTMSSASLVYTLK